MLIKLYHTNSSSNTLGKELTGETPFSVVLKDTTEVLQPEITLKSETLLDFNYAYIPDFDRYYFINNIESVANSLVRILLSVDVIESYKEDILNSWGLISKDKPPNFYVDSGYDSEVKKESTILKSDVVLDPDDRTIVLVSIGGLE